MALAMDSWMGPFLRGSLAKHFMTPSEPVHRHGTQNPVGVHRTDAEKKRREAHMFDLRQPFCIPFTLWIGFIGGKLDLYFARSSPSDVIQQFTDLITHSAATPYWASGWQTTSSHERVATCCSQKTAV